MSVQHLNLRCYQCGSTVLDDIALNQFKCSHCGAITLVKDTVSDRLDKVLDQVKDAAAERLAQQEALRQKAQQALYSRAGLAVLGALLVAGAIGMVFNRSKPARSTGAYEAAKVDIDPNKLVALDARQVLLGQGSSAKVAVLINLRNDTGVPIADPTLKLKWYDADQLVGESTQRLRRDVLLPGESEPIVFEAPRGKSFTRYELEKTSLRSGRDIVSQGSLKLDAMRFLRQEDSLLLVGQIKNTATFAINSIRLQATALDSVGKVLGFGDAYFDPGELPAGQSAFAKLKLETVGDLSQVKALEYVVSHRYMQADKGQVTVASPGRVVRTEQTAQTIGALNVTAQELLADDTQRFDLAQLQLKPLLAARDTAQELVYLTEITNLSADTIALKPGAIVRSYNGAQANDAAEISAMPDLYPGESYPVLIDPGQLSQLTQAKAEFKPILKAALPGTRPRLEVKLDSTQAGIGSVNVNFSRNYRYKYVQVTGQLRNASTQPVAKPVLWLMLRDSSGALTGFERLNNLAPIAPGESVPFTTRINQLGRDFAKVDTLYATR